MQEVLPEGGVIRKLWAGETAKYREHILRLDPESRRNRFAGGVSDDFISSFVDLSLSLDALEGTTDSTVLADAPEVHREEDGRGPQGVHEPERGQEQCAQPEWPPRGQCGHGSGTVRQLWM